jgi:predicted dehydrogenase
MKKVRWGIVSTADIGVSNVIPGMMKSPHSEVVALASRDESRARAALAKLGLRNARAYGRYEDLFADPNIDAIYNPLPNNQHVSVTLAAAKAGKHVLCEKPIALNSTEAEQLRAIPKGIVFQEAFMVRHHPQWLRAREIVRSGELGEVRAIRGIYTYFFEDPTNIRNILDLGGGSIYDIGCYPIVTSRFIYGAEPKRVVALIDRDPVLKTDRLASVIADFGEGRQLSFVCGQRTVQQQKMEILGSKGRVEILIPFNAPPGQRTAILVDTGPPFDGSLARREILPASDHYAEEVETFARAVLGEAPLAWSVDDAIAQMRVLDAVFESERTGGWVNVWGL